MAIRDVHARRPANLEYLKSCELENKVTGERIDLISKVMGSISNPEIRRMELMNTIAGIERYAASVGDVGMFITLTTPSKYHPTRQVGKGKTKRYSLIMAGTKPHSPQRRATLSVPNLEPDAHRVQR